MLGIQAFGLGGCHVNLPDKTPSPERAPGNKITRPPPPESCGFGWALQAGARTNNAAGARIRVITTLQESPVPLTLSALFLLRGAFPSSSSRAFGLRFTLTSLIISKKCSTVPKKSRALGEVGVLERLRKMTGYPGFLAGLLRPSLHQGPCAQHTDLASSSACPAPSLLKCKSNQQLCF